METLKTNNVKIIGHLVSTNLKEGTRKDNGQGYISGTITVSSVFGGTTKEYEIALYANAQTQAKQPNKLYISYSKLNELVGKKVEVTGDLRENRYWSANAKQLVSAQQINGRFIRGVSESTEEEATYELGGFVVTTLTERKNKEGKIYRYDLQLGQADYKGSMLSIFTLHVKPTDTEIINGLRTMYKAGDTVLVNGILDFTVETVTKASENVGFGAGAVHTFTNRSRQLWIVGGSNVYTDESKYSELAIRDLIAAYKSRDVELAAKAQNGDSKEDVEDKPVVTNRQTSLI
jgi:hypothetical protein